MKFFPKSKPLNFKIKKGMVINMKKTLSVILTAVMLVSLLAVAIPVSATDAEIGDVAVGYVPDTAASKISTADEFAAMNADGNYYLAADIDLSSLATPYYNGCFKGTFDGCGHTIKLAGYTAFRSTTTATIKNLKITGTVNTPVIGLQILGDPGNDYALGAVTQMTKGGTFENILCSADITYEGTDSFPVGAVFGTNYGGNVTITNCKNTGDIKAPGVCAGIASYVTKDSHTDIIDITGCINTGSIESTAGYAGGIIGRGRAVNNIDNCINTGNVTASKEHAAGIVAYHYGFAAGSNLTVTNCANSGVITGKGPSRASGIVGCVDGGNNSNTITMEHCYNSGKASNTEDNANVAGILAFNNRSQGKLIIKYCVNAGELEGLSSVAGICARTKANDITLEYNVNAGTITGPENGVFGILYADTADGFTFNVKENYYLAGVPASNNASVIANAVSADQLASGEVAYKLNTSNGSDVFYQTIGTDSAPVLDNTHGTVYYISGTYTNDPNYTSGTETTEPVTTEPETTDSDKSSATGDNSWIFVAIAVLSILGFAVVAKRRENV